MKTKPYSDMYRKQVKEYLDLIRVKYGNISYADLARLIDQTPQNFHQKVKRGSINATELFQIADVLDASVHFVDKKTRKIII